MRCIFRLRCHKPGFLGVGLLLILGSLSATPSVADIPLALLKPVDGIGFSALQAKIFSSRTIAEVETNLDLGSASYEGPHHDAGEAEPATLEHTAEPHGDPASEGSHGAVGSEAHGHLEVGVSEANAELAIRVGDFETAALIYAKIIAQTHDVERRKNAYLSLAEVYRSMDDAMRVVSILERFRREYPEEKRMPEILLRLGFLYREAGAPQKAVDAFFGVLKQSFNLNENELGVYREITHEASYQIAETYYRMHQYDLASEFFTRLLRAARPNTPERLDLLSKCAYANYFSGDYRKVLYLLELKDWTGLESSRQAEFRFLRASAFWALSDRERARNEVINLADLEVEPNEDPYWNFWWKYVGNELANDLFAQSDYAMAHKLYYSLLHLSTEQKWQLPVIFQIGRCLEHLGNTAEAHQIYARILRQIDDIEAADRAGNLIVLQTRVEDQIKNLAWEEELGRAKELYSPPTQSQPNDRSDSLAHLDARGR